MPIEREVKTFILDEQWIVNEPFEIPAAQVVKFYMRSPPIPADLSLISVLAHAHLLCQNFKAYALTPDGEIVPLLKINRWDFNWQMNYQFSHLLKIPKGSYIFAEAEYDNTANNPRNPHHPPKNVMYGWGTKQEMMNLIFEYVDYRKEDEKN